jgi:hypothetical protein
MEFLNEKKEEIIKTVFAYIKQSDKSRKNFRCHCFFILTENARIQTVIFSAKNPTISR